MNSLSSQKFPSKTPLLTSLLSKVVLTTIEGEEITLHVDKGSGYYRVTGGDKEQTHEVFICYDFETNLG